MSGRASGGLIVPTSDGIGVIETVGWQALQPGYFYCNGEEKLITAHPDLYAVIGTQHNLGTETAGYFRLPFATNLKEYALTIVGNSWSNTRSYGVPYTTNDGTWRLRFYCDGSFTSNTVNSFTITGVSFKTTIRQSFSVSPGSAVDWCYGVIVGATGVLEIRSGSAQASASFWGDIELESKPTFVDDNSTSNYKINQVIRYAPKSGVVVGYNVPQPILSVSANKSLTDSEVKAYQLIAVTTGSSANVVITLPSPSSVTSYPIKIQKVDSGTKFVEIARNASENIRGVALSIYAIAQNETIELVSDGTNWLLLSDPMRTVSVAINYTAGTPAIVARGFYNFVSSITDVNTGRLTINMPTGVFSDTPNTAFIAADTRTITAFDSESSTAISLEMFDEGSGGWIDSNIRVILVGLK